MKRIYVAELELHGLLVFSRVVSSLKEAITAPGTVVRTSSYIHNYPLIYGLLGYSAEQLVQPDKPAYRVVEEALELGVYAYPAEPVSVRNIRLLLSTQPETLLKQKAKPKTSHPLQVHYFAAAPGSKYRTLIVAEAGHHIPRYIRIGKKRWGLFRLRLYLAESIEKQEGLRASTIPVNTGDMKNMGVRIASSRAVLVTRNYGLIGERAVVGYVEAEPTYRITYLKHGRPRTIYAPIPEKLTA